MEFYEISKVLCGLGNLEEILVTALSVLESFLDMDNSLIMLLDEAGRTETVMSGSSGSTDARRYFEALPEQAIGQIIATAVPLVVTDVGQDRVFTWDTSAWGPPGFNYSFIGVPIRDQDRVIGTLTIDRVWLKWGTVQINDDLCFLKMVADLIGQTVRLHRLVARDHTWLLEGQSPLSKQPAGL